MRNIIFTILLCSASFFAIAQTLSISPKVLQGQGANSGGQDYICTVSNNTLDSNFKWKILKYNPPANWLMSFCDPINCIASISVGQSGSFIIPKGKSGQMHITYTFNNTPGSDVLQVTIFSIANPSIADTFILYTNSWQTGINEVNQNSAINIYPNPVKETIHLKYTTASMSPANIDIYNIIGVKVKTLLYDGSSTDINIADLKNGMYILRISDGNNTYSKTFNKAD